MQCMYFRWDLEPDGWPALHANIDPKSRSKLLNGLLEAFRSAGALICLEETAYTDRDFSAAHAAFYSKLHQPRPKHCRRFHFFSDPLDTVWETEDWADTARALEREGKGAYLGYVVVRPVSHAPVSHALLCSRSGAPAGADVAVRSTYPVHLLGAKLEVEGAPLTEQDQLTGACAQSTIWTAGRHLHMRHEAPWFSVVDITEAAVSHADSAMSTVLPIGSESLSADNIVRALRAMGEHPVVYDRRDVAPSRTLAQYLDSGIPVIVGLGRGGELGHAVVAVGTISNHARPFAAKEPAPSDRVTHILVHDDQRGPYRPLAVDGHPEEENGEGPGDEGHDPADAAQDTPAPAEADATPPEPAPDRGPPREATLADVDFMIVPLPAKVYLKAEVAEAIARDKIQQIFKRRQRMIRLALKRNDESYHADPAFDGADPAQLLARTYLTSGWKYKYRIMRNDTSFKVREEVSSMHLPRYVWVTEFSLPEDVADPDPCRQRVRGHVVVDATGNFFDGAAVLFAHVPGLLMGERPNAEVKGGGATRLQAIPDDRTYYPKVRGWNDFSQCEVPGEVGPPAA